jgi:FAD/FMN-containing dehydrogenase
MGMTARQLDPTLRVLDPVLLGFAEEVGTDDPISVAGGRSQWLAGGAPSSTVREVRAPSGVVAYRPEEMIVTVRAGTTVTDLHMTLAEHGQTTVLPDPSIDDTATVGGVLAVGDSGIDRLGHGPLRDAVLQLRYVSADGLLVTVGGPTVKNVSGFDLCRVMVRSLGTLGCFAEVILRTRPVPAVSQWWRLDGVEPLAVLGGLYRPTAVLWDGASTWVQLNGHHGDVAGQVAALQRVGSPHEVAGAPSLPPHRWSLDPTDALGAGYPGPAIVEVGVGTVHTIAEQPRRSVTAAVAELHRRLKDNFDPTGRLNPGRDPLAR